MNKKNENNENLCENKLLYAPGNIYRVCRN